MIVVSLSTVAVTVAVFDVPPANGVVPSTARKVTWAVVPVTVAKFVPVIEKPWGAQPFSGFGLKAVRVMNPTPGVKSPDEPPPPQAGSATAASVTKIEEASRARTRMHPPVVVSEVPETTPTIRRVAFRTEGCLGLLGARDVLPGARDRHGPDGSDRPVERPHLPRRPRAH